MGFIELADVAYALPGGWTLFEGVSFRVPAGEAAGLVGGNGCAVEGRVRRPRAGGRARGSRRRERHRQVDAAPPDRRRRPPDRGLDPDRRTGRADAAVPRLRTGLSHG